MDITVIILIIVLSCASWHALLIIDLPVIAIFTVGNMFSFIVLLRAWIEQVCSEFVLIANLKKIF